MSKKEQVFELPDKSDDAMDIPVEKSPRKKREMSDEAKEKMLANLAKGREAKKAKAELAKGGKPAVAKEEPKVVESPKEVEAPKPKKAVKAKQEVQVDINAERERLSLINKMIGKEKAKPMAKRAEPVLSETTKQSMKAERVKTVEQQAVVEPVKEAPKVVAPVVPVKPEVVHVVKRTFTKAPW